MKKIYTILTLTVIFVLIYGSISVFADTSSNANIDKTAAANGNLRIGYTSEAHKQVKLMVQKGDNKYIYNLKNDGTQESFPLQMGNGDYQIYLFENLQGNTYVPVYFDTITLHLTNPKMVYLYSVQNINWDDKMKAIAKAKDLTNKLKTDKDKINAIYNYVITNVKYDFPKLKKLNSLPSPYIPIIDKTLMDKKGICYDYASLFAAMLRSVNIPTKLDMGYCQNVTEYHAWNEVYLTDQNKWATVDTTYDSQMKASKESYSLIKDIKLYSTSKIY